VKRRGGGPVPKPNAVKKAQGASLAREPAAAQKTPVDAAGLPPCPPGLDPDAQAIWRETVQRLDAMGVLDQTVPSVIESYASDSARLRKLKAIAQTADPFVETKTGRRESPEWAAARKLGTHVEKLTTNLGLHYAAVARGAVGAPAGGDVGDSAREVEEFLFGTAPFTVVDGGKKESA
jgi:phage terminase small subunit